MSRRAADPSEYLAIAGRGIDDIRLAKKARVLPGQRCSGIDVSPVNYTFEVQAMSAEKLSFVLLAVFTIAPCVDDNDSLLRYAKLKLSNHVNELVQGVIEGETRVLAACMSMEEILKPTNEFKKEVFEKVQLQLNQFGLLIYNAKVKQLVDVRGHEYFSYLGGQKTQMEAANGRAEDRLSMAEIVFVGSDPKRLLLKKKLSRDDLKKLYLPKQVKLTDLCPAALASDSPNRFELFIYDFEKTRWQMTLRETSKDRWHLIEGWSQFAKRWNFSEGQEIHFFEYTCNTEAKFLLISPLPQPFRFYL